MPGNHLGLWGGLFRPQSHLSLSDSLGSLTLPAFQFFYDSFIPLLSSLFPHWRKCWVRGGDRHEG